MKLKSAKLTALAIASFISLGTLCTIPTYADPIDCYDKNIPESVREAAGCTNAITGETLPNAVINIINAVIGISGLVAVAFIVYGGIQYMTSSGDASKLQKAKHTILYAVIGLIVCVLAFAIVNFVITKML